MPRVKICLTSCLALLVAMPLHSQPTEISQEEALNRDAANYSRDYGVRADEAKRRLLIMNNAGPEIDSLEAELGERVSGPYFQNRDGAFRLVVKTVGPERRPPRKIKVRGKSGSQRVMPAELELDAEFVPGGRQSRKAVQRLMARESAKFRQRFPNLQAVSFDERTGAIELRVKGNPSEASAANAIAQQLSVELGVSVAVRVNQARRHCA